MSAPKMRRIEEQQDGDMGSGGKGSTATSETVTSAHPCLEFLSPGEHSFSVHSSETHGVHLVASKPLPPRSLVLVLPTENLITYAAVCATPLSKIISNLPPSSNIQISPEALTWLNMIVWLRQEEKTNFQTYLRSLSTIPPNASSWPQYLQDELIGSNVHAVLDTSGDNDGVAGNISAVKNLHSLLERIRESLKQQHENDEGTTQKPETPGTVLAFQALLGEPSIFTAESISWARGHFISRRFPDLQKKMPPNSSANDEDEIASGGRMFHSVLNQCQHLNNHLPGYGDTTSTLLPIVDLMNHNPVKKNTCTVEITKDGLEVRSGEMALEAGDELCYCYGEALSNEVLLQAYGFCLPDNEADTVSVKLRADCDNSTSDAFFIDRGGVSAIPREMWRRIAGADGDDDEGEELDIGSGDLERLLQYMSMKLEQLNKRRENKLDEEHESARANDLDKARLSFIETYKKGQREIFEALITDMNLMLQ